MNQNTISYVLALHSTPPLKAYALINNMTISTTANHSSGIRLYLIRSTNTHARNAPRSTSYTYITSPAILLFKYHFFIFDTAARNNTSITNPSVIATKPYFPSRAISVGITSVPTPSRLNT